MIEIIKKCNVLRIRPVHPVVHVLSPLLSYTRLKPLYGKAAAGANKAMETEHRFIGDYRQEEDTIYTYAGLLERILVALKNFEVSYHDASPVLMHEPELSRVSEMGLRGGQARMMASILVAERGQYNGMTALGKSYLIKQLCSLYPQEDCRIVVCAQQKQLVLALHEGLSEVLREPIGLCGAGGHSPARVTVSTAKSMYKVHPEKASILLYDEVHTAAADTVFSGLSKFTQARMYGFSASTECRTDKADLRVEAIFGPVRVHVPYVEGLREGYVANVRALFYEFNMPQAMKYRNPVRRRRELIWRNAPRNGAIAAIARHWESELHNPQILVLTDTFEHVLELARWLPDYDLAFAGVNTKVVERMRREGTLPPRFGRMKAKELTERIRLFEHGALRRMISTGFIGTGVDMKHLDVVVRADGGASEIGNIQFRGRVTRGDTGVYCDLFVTGDDGERRRANARFASCKRDGWNPEVLVLPTPVAHR